MKDEFPNFPWIVVASQEEREVTSPIRNVAAFVLFVFILGEEIDRYRPSIFRSHSGNDCEENLITMCTACHAIAHHRG